jgi:uncharacterized Rmd1/YagE family protein
MEPKKLTAYLTCEKFADDIYASINQRYKATLNEDIVIIDIEKEQYIILFKYGVFVAWNVSYENIKFFLDYLKSYEIKSFTQEITEEFDFVYGDEFKIHLDTIFLDDHSLLAKTSLSHSIAQSLKLADFEQQILKSIEINSTIPQSLATNGDIALSRKDIAKKIGELFLVKSKLNLHYDLLDTPEFFWEYPEYENYYERAIKYLDIKPRVEVLNKKVEVIQELLNVLNNEQNHRHSSFLEWIIIVLITFEIIMNLMEHLL